MSHALSVSPRTLAVLLSSMVALACNKDEQKKAEPAAGATAAPVGDKDAPAAQVPPPGTTAGAVTLGSGGTLAALSAEPEVLGHFAVANASRLLADVKTQLLPPKYAGFLEEAALRSMVSMMLEKRSNLAMNYDLAAPLGCALVDPKVEDPKLGCTFGYKGGATAFVTDLGEANKQADPAGHTAAYSIEGKSMYVDGAGETVFVSTGADTHAKTQAYLQRNVIARAGDMHGDLEVVVYVASAFDRYRDQLAPLFEQMNGAPPQPTGNPAVDGAVKAWTDYRQRSTKTTMDRFAEFAQLSLFFSVEPAGVMLGGAMFPKAGSQMAKDMAIYSETRLDPAFAGLAPAGTLALFAMHLSPRAYELHSAVEGRQMMAQVWAALTGRDAAATEAAMTAFQKENSELYDGQTLFALGREQGALFGLTMAGRLQAGKSARDSWKAWSAGFTPTAVLGAEFSKYVDWKFTPDAANLDGVAVDRWTIEPGAEIKGKMEKDMSPEGRAFVDKALGGLAINVDRAESGGSVIFVIAPKAEANYMKRVIAAFSGTGNIAGGTGLAKVFARDPESVGIFAVDLKETMTWLRELTAFGAKTEGVPQNIGTDLADFYFTGHYSKDGATAVEYVFSQQLIDQLKPMIPQ